MEIYIQREGLQLGPPYSLEEAKTYLADGLLAPDDLAWCEGMEEWVPLSNLVQVRESIYTHETPPDILAQPPPKITASELGAACFDLAMGFQDSYTELIQELQHGETDARIEDFGQLWIELICLGIFSVEYALEDTLKMAGPVEAILESYHSNLKRLSISEVPNFYEVISNRFPIYQNAAYARHPRGVSWSIGETFAIFCGNEGSARLVMTGSTLFDKIFNYVHQWIQEIGVENIAR